jgi:hypothetical protein
MQPIKILGLASLAALTAMSFVGVTSAMASEPTALCDIDPGPGLHEVCPSGHLTEHVHFATLEGEPARLLSSFFTLACDVLFLGDVLTKGFLAAEGEGLLISGNFTYTSCAGSFGNCKVSEENGPGHLNALMTEHELAELTFKFLVHFTCGSSLDCLYTGVGLRAHVLGPLLSELETGDASITELVMEKEAGGFLCPKKLPKLDFRVHPLEALYVTE